MAKIIRVESCIECPYLTEYNQAIRCHEMRDRILEDNVIIQSWCPLKDVPDKDER